MRGKEVVLTPEGRAKLQAELDYLRGVRRKEVSERLHAAKELNGTFDDPEYICAKDEQAFIEGRILTIEGILAQALVVREETQDHSTVHVGSHITVVDGEGEEEEFVIVGSAEANPRQHRISNESPVGAALLGKRSGDSVEVVAPGGVHTFRIVSVR